MLWLLLIPWVMGTVIADRVLKLNEPVGALSVGWATGWLYATMAVNFGLSVGLDLGKSMGLSLALCLLTSLVLLLRGPRLRWSGPGFTNSTWAFLLTGAAAVHVTANTILYLNPDDDYYLHSPLQGQLLKGTFPIINPYFPDVAYGGHYARDLMTVVMARLSGATLFGIQAPVTVSLQLAAFFILFTTLHRSTRSQLQAALGTLCVFAGANAGFRGGWLDTVANNNPLAQTVSALCFLLTLEALFVRPNRGATILAGITLGGLAWAYETDFAVVSLGLCGLAFCTLCLRCLKKSQVKTALAIVAILIPLAMLQGGIFKNLLKKVVGGHELSASKADLTLQSQNLEVSVKFPKDELFQIKLDRSGEEMSMAYSTLPFLRDLPKTRGAPGYVSVFSWYAIRIHWLALYLAPLCFLVLTKGRNWAGLLLWWVGFAGYFLPSVVNFGLWEAEVFRWEFVASWGFAGALGLALAQWWQGLKGPIWSHEGGLTIHRKGLAAALVLVVLLLNTYPTYDQVCQRTAHLDKLSSGILFPRASDWFERQPELDLQPADFRSGHWLSGQARGSDRLLTNFREENEFNVYFESSFVGLCGVRPAGHTFPLPFERLGTRPFRQSAAARAFWATLDPSLLGNLQPDWIYLRGRLSNELEGLPGLKLVHQEDTLHSLFKVSVPTLKEGSAVPGAGLVRLEIPADLEVEEVREARLILGNKGPRALQATTTFGYDVLDAEGKPVEAWDRFLQPIVLDIPAGGQQIVNVRFVTPHQDGKYRTVVRLGPEALEGETAVEVGNRRAVTGLELLDARPIDPLKAGQVARFRLRVRNAAARQLTTSRPVLAALVAKSDRALYEVRDFSELRLELGPGEETEIVLPAVVPEVTNGFELMILPRDGWGIWELPPGKP